MWLAVVVGFFSTFLLLISLLFAIVDVDLILASPTGMPYVQLIYNATGSYAGTVCMTLLILTITVLALIGESSFRRECPDHRAHCTLL
jgi:choline transport protein